MNWRNAVWWILYSMLAIALQSLLPGLDFLLPGFLVSVQERQPVQTACVGIWFVLLQEGMGNLAFGGVVLTFIVTIIFFYSGCTLFQGRNFLFVSLIGILLSAFRYVLFTLLCRLQEFPVNADVLLDECLFQAFFTPFVWWGASSLRYVVKNES